MLCILPCFRFQILFLSKKDTHGTLAFSGCYSAAHLFRLVPYSRLDSGMICFFVVSYAMIWYHIKGGGTETKEVHLTDGLCRKLG